MNTLAAAGIALARDGRALLDGVSLRAGAGELLGLAGPNGAGKSSLLKCLAGLWPCQGEIRVGGEPLAAFSARRRARRIAYLGQDERIAWPLALADFVALGRLPHRRGGEGGGRDDEAAVEAAIAAMQLTALRARRVDRLSGGERARARLARALAVGAPILLADEPVAALDPFHQLNVMELLARQCAAGATAVVALHDLTLTSRFCTRVLLLDHGRAVAFGEARQVLTPRNLQQVYHVSAMSGEHEDESYVVPWRCHPHPSCR
jgi:iron complex transport system ATP-binding protein